MPSTIEQYRAALNDLDRRARAEIEDLRRQLDVALDDLKDLRKSVEEEVVKVETGKILHALPVAVVLRHLIGGESAASKLPHARQWVRGDLNYNTVARQIVAWVEAEGGEAKIATPDPRFFSEPGYVELQVKVGCRWTLVTPGYWVVKGDKVHANCPEMDDRQSFYITKDRP